MSESICEKCTGDTVESGVCRNCGEGSPKEPVGSTVESETTLESSEVTSETVSAPTE